MSTSAARDLEFDALKHQLFDPDRLAELAQQKSAVKAYRSLLEHAETRLHQLFREDFPIRQLVYGRAWLIDQVLSHAWQNFQLDCDPNISLVAVGGYGRGELHPHSDIDLLVLYQGNALKKQQQNLERFLTFLWDIGLKVGHSVRTAKQCRDLAKVDITVATSLMESRTIAGAETLRTELGKLILPGKIWSAKNFFAAKRDEQAHRHNKYDDTEYNLEPNVKHCPGGLRDIQMIGWVAKRHFGGDSLRDLVSHRFLTESELQTLTDAQDFLWRIRYGLHMLACRAEDRLVFDYQKALAKIFGFKDSKNKLAIEKLMQQFYLVVMRIRQLNDMLLQHFDEAIVRAKEKPVTKPLNARFKITNDYIEVVHDDVLEQTPAALLEIFLLMAQNPAIQGVRASTIRLIQDSLDLIDNSFRSDPQNTAAFMELLRSPFALSTQLYRMRRYGVLGKYLPEFGRVMGQMQHDLFHIYTVDAHTLLLVQYIRRFHLDLEPDRFPLTAVVTAQIPKLELLYIAALYHDIAKGRGGDHSELGARDVRRFCKKHQLSDWDTDLVAWLVENHLIMSMTAQRRDISDPAIIQEFASRMQDQLHLDYLFVLTVADINATNPTLWNSWRASLLRQLYLETKRAIGRGLDNPIDISNAIARKQEEVLASLPYNPVIISGLWQQLGDDYFIQHSAEDIAWHTQGILAHTKPETPLVLVKDMVKQRRVGGTQIFIYAQTEHHLFAATAATLEQLGLNIVDARISKSPSNFNINSYVVLEANGKSVGHNPRRVQEIVETLVRALQDPQRPSAVSKRHRSRRLQYFSMPTQVSIYNEPQQPYTMVEVVTPDRPGLLAKIGRIFLDHQLVLQKAKIATLGERVEDVFFITTENQQRLSDEQVCIALEKEICRQLDEAAAAKQPQGEVMEISI